MARTSLASQSHWKGTRFTAGCFFDGSYDQVATADLLKTGAGGNPCNVPVSYTRGLESGMRPALDWIEPKVAPGSGLGPNLSDERVKCGIALSPQAPGDPFFLKESYSSLRVPLMGISGTKDKQQNGEPPIARYESFKLWPEMQKKNLFVWLGNASHLDFTDSTGGDVQGRESSNRADVQNVVRPATLMFFNKCLKNDNSPSALITTESLKPYIRGEINSIEVLSK